MKQENVNDGEDREKSGRAGVNDYNSKGTETNDYFFFLPLCGPVF